MIKGGIEVKKLLSGALTLSMVLSLAVPAMAIEPGENGPQTEYQVTITPEEREAIHDAVDDLSGYIGDMVVGDGTYDPLTLVGGLATGSSYDSISHGKAAAGSIPTEYPFAVPDTEANRNEGDRKTAKLAWVEQLAKNLGFEVVVHRQDDKYVYVEIGDPDAPEMVMALSHLDSPTASISEEQLSRWVDYDGNQSSTAYHTPYVRDGWLYGAGVQDDSGPTLATLFAAKALMDSGVSFDRRIRIVMGAYEDSNPGVPSVEDTLDYMDIPYYTSNPSFYDNWAYKSLNREEIPIAAYTSDSRFPVVVGNSTAQPRNALVPSVYMDLRDDTAKPFRLLSAGANVTEREGDPTLKDIVHGSTSQIASKAVFELQASPDAEANEEFIASVEAAATERGWLPTAEGETAKVSAVYDTEKDAVVLTINTDVAMEMPTPQYGKNAVVWGMYLISEALGDQGITAEDMKLKQAADGITALFFQNYTEGEAYIGRYMGIPENLLRNPDSGVANLTFALMGGIQGTYDLVSFYDPETGALSIPLYIRSMHTNAQDYNTAMDAVTAAWENWGFELRDTFAFSNPTLYADHDNPLIDLQLASYLATMQSDPEAFADVYDLLSLSYPVGTTGGTLASNYTNKMTAFGAVIPGNERWWHSANERIKVDSIVEMTKMMADGMLEMARYSDAAGAQLMWADIPGLNSERAELDLLDITVGTYQDASADVAADLGDDFLLGATKFDIHMWKERGNSSFTQAAYDAGHGEGGVYLPLDDPDFLENTFVMPMRLEFKVERPDGVSNSGWNNFVRNGLDDLTFYIQKNGEAIPLTLSSGEDEDQFYSVRTTEEDPDSVYVAVNLAITDSAYDGVSTVVADSKTDLYKLNDEYLATHENHFPERGQIEERGFFLFGDGEKNAQFTSPEAIYVVADEDAFDSRSSGGGGGGSSSSRPQQPDQPDQPSQDENMFNDVSSSAWYAEAVEYVYDNGLMTGVSGSSFAPNNTLTRAMVVQTLYAMAGKPEVSGSESFADVASNDWFADAVTWASANGIVNGYSAAQFAPGDPVTREQLALILYGYAQIRGYNTTQGGMSIREFSDYGAISDWALEAMDWAVNAGLLSGKGNGVLDPAGTATRAEVAQILMNFCENIAR